MSKPTNELRPVAMGRIGLTREVGMKPKPRAPGPRYEAPSAKRSVKIAGRKTSMSLEDPFWDALNNIATLKNVTIVDLVSMINKERGSNSLSSAIRLFVLAHYRS
jgi:predicted DNA-binding ribbon-helix-helix protein